MPGSISPFTALRSNSSVFHEHHNELRLLASFSTSCGGGWMELLESDVELNTVLRRGTGPQRVLEQKRTLISELAGRENDVKRLDYPEPSS
ncbi:uncharacterized protein N7503_006145 [Penicillium pulvis]|uniref:uncharacterized protein n=1 Tax=Penicillium pulvis TaxID=1562058 RepID=UPI002548F9E7|nr:uncharacterized protein N7503_006145 [Penicillium pulvis]KAJ5803695.1 hypothetical protein N7503_006145 [Penicillium pulvis]